MHIYNIYIHNKTPSWENPSEMYFDFRKTRIIITYRKFQHIILGIFFYSFSIVQLQYSQYDNT